MLKKLFALIFVTGLVTACSTDGDDTIDGTSYTNCFNVVTDLTTNNQSLTLRPTYSFSYNITKGTAIVVMNNIMAEPNGAPLNLTINDVPWGVNKNGWRIINEETLVCDGHKLENVTIASLPRTQPFGGPVFYINFRLDGKYLINTEPTQVNYYGLTTVSSADDTSVTPFLNDQPQYLVSLNPETMKASILLNQAKFAPSMPALNFQLIGIPFKITKEGFEIEQGDAPIIPQDLQGVPYTSFPITDLEMESNLMEGGKIGFDCKAGKLGNYKVSAKLFFLP